MSNYWFLQTENMDNSLDPNCHCEKAKIETKIQDWNNKDTMKWHLITEPPPDNWVNSTF